MLIFVFSHSPFSDTELSIEGVVYLMQYIESVFPGALSLEGFYRSTPPQQGEKLEIIRYIIIRHILLFSQIPEKGLFY